MNTNLRIPFVFVLVGLGILAIFPGGCGSVTRTGDMDGTQGDSLFSVVEQSEYGEYELVARRLGSELTSWEFTVQARRTITKNDFTFVWEFGDGSTGTGNEQSYQYAEAGTYLIKVTALDSRENVAFVLLLTIDVESDSNHAPVADAGVDQTTEENTLVFLYAGKSYDPDNDAIEYKWIQVSGVPVQILNPTEATASFVAPFVDQDSDIEFAVLVSDGTFSSQDTTTVHVLDVILDQQNDLIADAGIDQSVIEGQFVTLDASASINNTELIPLYSWKQISGPTVNLTNATLVKASFQAPVVSGTSELLSFSLDLSSSGLSSTDYVSVTVKPEGGVDVGDCVASSTVWQNIPFVPQSGLYMAEFDVTPEGNELDAIIALSNIAGNTFSDFSTLIRYNASGFIDVRDGGTYRSDVAIAYLNNVSFHVRMQVSIPTHTYSVYVTPAGDSQEITLAANYSFRIEQNAVTNLENMGVWSGTGTLQICNFILGLGGPLSVSAGNDKTIVTGESTMLDGSASGGSGSYTYAWSPTTGLSNAFSARPSASPTATTIYTLTVADSNGTIESDTVTVFVAAAVLSANAGPDLAIVDGGSAVLQGLASGGSAPYSYSWTPSTGLSNASIAQPTASPAQSTNYTLTVTDNVGNTSSDSAMVNLVSGTIYYVDKNSAGASDSNTGSISQPFKTIAKGVDVVQAGETVIVKAGVYYESIIPWTSGASGALITLMANPGDTVVLDGQNSRSEGVDFGKPVKYVRVEGFEIRNHVGSGVSFQGWGDNGVEGIELVNNYIHHNNEDGINARNAINTLIDSNEIFANGLTAVAFGGQYGALQLTISGNDIHYNGKDGLQGAGTDILMEHNRIYDQFHTNLHQDAFDCSNLKNTIIRYNTLYDNTQLIYLHNLDGGFENIEIYGNVMYTDRYYTVAGSETSGIFIDGRFTSAAANNVSIHSNTFGWTGYAGIWFFGNASNVVLRNNLFFNSGINVDVNGSSQVDSDYNMLFNSNSNMPLGPNDKIADPQFVNYQRHSSWDFRLTTSSPARNTGDPSLNAAVALPADFQDIDKTPRPASGNYDIGAYEH